MITTTNITNLIKIKEDYLRLRLYYKRLNNTLLLLLNYFFIALRNVDACYYAFMYLFFDTKTPVTIGFHSLQTLYIKMVKMFCLKKKTAINPNLKPFWKSRKNVHFSFLKLVSEALKINLCLLNLCSLFCVLRIRSYC